MTIESWPIEKPIAYARNARKISEAAVAKVAASIKEFGFRQPLVVDSEAVIICGHARLLAAKRLGLKEVPVHVAIGLTPAQVKAYRLMDNRSHQETSWDIDLLPLEFADLKDLSIDLSLTGFDDLQVMRFLNGGSAAGPGFNVGDIAFKIVLDCDSEVQQAELLRRFTDEGYTCRPLIA